jgi:asparagine synthase (glutamine-hydrolysing)
MCGIFGIWNTDNKQLNAESITTANRIMQHRGPDDEGFLFTDTRTGHWTASNPPVDQNFDLAFGFRRLSILDLSPAGHQPMSYQDDQLWIVFNGEIYNYIELRDELINKGYTFRTATDTEVILAAYQEWGEDCVVRFNGMWAFAIWDLTLHKMFCSRDRFGIKPFYYCYRDGSFYFASEIKAILETTHINRQPNPAVIYDYLSFNLLDHSSETFFIGIHQLSPAHKLSLKDGKLKIERYWDLELGERGPSYGSKDYIDEFRSLFTDAVRIHLRSDVPVATCLSGGLDSSSIVCTMNRLLFGDQSYNTDLVSSRQKTFSSCFENPSFDERQYIDQVLQETGAEANFTFPSPKKLLTDLSRIIWYQEEPFGSLSIFAQWCVMEKVHAKGIKVTLDGQGGDEILAGYHGYFDYFWGSLLGIGRFGTLWHEWKSYKGLFGGKWLSIFARTLRPFAPAPALAIARHYKRGGEFGTQTLGVNPGFARLFQQRNLETYHYTNDPINNSLYANLTRLSIPKLLHYEDRNSMAFSVEARVPFLDYRLVELAFRLPLDQVIKDGYTKIILRNAMQGLIPDQIRMRKDKMGFVTPERLWMANELKDWSKEIIHSKSFCSRPYFNVPEIHRSFDEYSAGKRDLTALSWRWLNLELWLRQMIEGEMEHS